MTPINPNNLNSSINPHIPPITTTNIKYNTSFTEML